ncbi:LacI family DNA-binding transcriptional regulator [Microlunatus lacustris]
MPAVRLTDVAVRAGVSLATASRVLNGSLRSPAESIAVRVRAAADELGYVANAQAQALARSATGLVGLVVHDISDPYFSSIVRGAQSAARERSSQVLLASTDRHEQSEVEAVKAFAMYRTDAIVLAGSRGAHSDQALTRELQRYTANGGRVVTFGHTAFAGSRVVEVANEDGGARLVAALVDRGRRRFAILGGPEELVTTQHRVAGFRRALAAAGLEPLLVVHGDFTSDGGRAATEACLEAAGPGTEGADQPLCLLAVNDVMALGALAAVRSHGLAVPDDVEVAGFDDIPTLRHVDPPLTTFRLPLEEMGRRAAELALATEEPGPVHIEGEVVLRLSAGAER